MCVSPSFNNKDKRKTDLTLLGLYFPNLLLLLLSRLLGAQAPSPLYHLPLVWEPPDQKPANSQLIQQTLEAAPTSLCPEHLLEQRAFKGIGPIQYTHPFMHHVSLLFS